MMGVVFMVVQRKRWKGYGLRVVGHVEGQKFGQGYEGQCVQHNEIGYIIVGFLQAGVWCCLPTNHDSLSHVPVCIVHSVEDSWLLFAYHHLSY